MGRRVSVTSAAIITLAVTVALGFLARGGLFSVEGTRSLLAVALLATLMYAAFQGGVWSGLVSAVISAAYAIWAYRRFPLPYETAADIIRRDVLLAVILPALALAVGILRKRVDGLMGNEHRIRTAAERANRRLRELQIITDTAVANLTSDRLPDELLVRVREILSVDSAVIFLIGEDQRTLSLAASTGVGAADPRGSQIPLALGLPGRVAVDGRPVAVVEATATDFSSPALRDAGLRSLLGVPLFAGGRILGVLQVGSVERRAFSDEEIGHLQRVADRAAIAIDRQHLYERAYRIAETLQRASLPEALPHVPGLELDSAYVPGGSEAGIGGDWYDAFRLPDGRVGVTIGDVAGRGLGAAVAMGQIRQSLRAAALVNSRPSAVLETTSRLMRLADNAAIATAVFGVLDPVALTFTYATAGHPPPVLVAPNGRVEDLPHRGVPLGTFQKASHSDMEVTLLPGSRLILYTDGLIEHARDAAAGHAALIAALKERDSPGPHPAQVLLDRVLGGQPAADDVAILIVSLAGQPVDRIDLTLPALPASLPLARQAVRQLTATFKLGEERSFAVEVAVGEAVGNVIEHAYRGAPGTFTLRGGQDGQRLVFEIEDEGVWRARRDEGRGRGLHFMRMLSDAVEVRRTTHGTLVRLSLALEGASSPST